MKRYSKTYNCCNSLLSFMRSFDVVQRTKEYYAKFENDAPPILLEQQMNELQNILDKAKSK